MTERSDHGFDPASSDTFRPASPDLRQALAFQGTLVGQHDLALRDVVETLRGLSVSVSRLESQSRAAPLPPSLTTPVPVASGPPPAMPLYLPREPYVPAPERYDLVIWGRVKPFCCNALWFSNYSRRLTLRINPRSPSLSDC